MLDALTGSAAIESLALQALHEHAGACTLTPPTVRLANAHAVPAGWQAMTHPAQAANAAARGGVPNALRHDTAAGFPSALQVTGDVRLSRDSVRSERLTLNVPPRTIHALSAPSLERVARLMAACENKHAMQVPSPVLDRANRLTFEFGDVDLTTEEAKPCRVHLDHRLGHVRACTVVEPHSETAPLVVLFDPHEPLVCLPGESELTSAAFMARLPNELWLLIRDRLDVRDQSNMREVGRAMQTVFGSPEQVAAAGISKLKEELYLSRPLLAISELKEIDAALRHPALPAEARKKLLAPLRRHIEACLDLFDRTKVRANLRLITTHWPAPVKDFIEDIRKEHAPHVEL